MAYKKKFKNVNRIIYVVSGILLFAILSVVVVPSLWEEMGRKSQEKEITLAQDKKDKDLPEKTIETVESVKVREKVEIVYPDEKADKTEDTAQTEDDIFNSLFKDEDAKAAKAAAAKKEAQKPIEYTGRFPKENDKLHYDYVNDIVNGINERKLKKLRDEIIAYKKKAKAKDLDALGVVDINRVPSFGYSAHLREFFEREFANTDDAYERMYHRCYKITVINGSFKMNDLNKNILKSCTVVKGNLVINNLSERYKIPQNVKITGDLYVNSANDVKIPASIIVNGSILSYNKNAAMY